MSTQHTAPDQWHIQQVHDHVTALTAERDRLLEELAQVYETRDRAGIQLANANERLRAVNAELVAALHTAFRWHNGSDWRFGSQEQRESWVVHRDILTAAIARAEQKGE